MFHQAAEELRRNRRVLVVGVGLLLVLVATSLPTIFYIWDPPLEDNNDQSVSAYCNNSQRVKWESLANSPCSVYFDWSQTNNRSVSRNISATCDFATSDKILTSLKAILYNVRQEGLSQQCKRDATYLFCHHVYRDCEMSYHRPTAQECLDIQHKTCGNYIWEQAKMFVPILDREHCIGMPDCYKHFLNASTTHFQGITSNSTTGPQNESQVPCTPPLVRTEIRDMSPYLECSPKCLTEEWITEAEKQSLEVLLYLTGIIVWFCAVTTFITWAKIAELRQFPQSTLLYIIIGFAIASVGYTLPLVIGRRTAYCSHPDLLSMQEDPSVVCKIQGVLVHFGLASALIWWLCSIFNVFVSVYIVSPVNPIQKYSKIVYMVEASLSLIVPAALVAVVLGDGKKYTLFSQQVITCGPPSLKLFYYTMALPLQLVVIFGVVMTAYIVFQLHKAKGSIAVKSSSSVSSAASQTTIQVRFLLIIIFFPLTLGVVVSTIILYYKFSEDSMGSFLEYLSCLQTKSDHEVCSKLYHDYKGMITAIIDLIMFDLFSLVTFAYVLTPRLARKFWMHKITTVYQKLANLIAKNRKVTDESELDSSVFNSNQISDNNIKSTVVSSPTYREAHYDII